MKGKLLKLIALLVTVCVLFSGCGFVDAWNYLIYGYYPETTFSQMEYQRPDVTALETAARECAELSGTERNIDTLVTSISGFTEKYTDFYTQYMIAYIRYCQDMTDSYWEKEYSYCEERTAQVESARDQLMHTLAQCDLREELAAEEYFGEGWYEDYEGESIWTEEFQTLIEKESELESRYYELSSEAMSVDAYSEEFYSVYGVQMEELYVRLVALRQQIAWEAGYDSYSEFAYDYYYGRDFTDRQAVSYCNDIRQELVPIYRELAQSGYWSEGISGTTEAQTLRYVREMAGEMGGQVQEAFEFMTDNDLYDISWGENKYTGSFETYLYSYMEPYVFVGPTQTVRDHLSFAHEFGHFCNDYASQGSVAGIDVAEVFSQGLEYLSLFYTDGSEELEKLKMTDSLATYVEQAAYACFEQQVYGLAPEDVNVENVRALFQRTGDAFGFDSWGFDSRMYVAVAHFYVQPLYVISYVVSNDAALQLYQLEAEQTGAGLQVFTDTLATEQESFMAYLEEAQLESPFEEGRIQQVRKTFEAVLN